MIKQRPYFILLLSFLFTFFSLYFLLLIERGQNAYHGNWLFVLGALLYGMLAYNKVVKGSYDTVFCTQFVWMSLGISLISLFVFKLLFELPNIQYYHSLFTVLFFIPSFIVIADDLRFSTGIIRGRFKHTSGKETLYVGGLIIILLLLSWQKNTYYMHDCHIFYEMIGGMDSVLDLFDFEKLSLAGHISVAYAFWGVFSRLIFNSGVAGFNVYAKALLIVAIYGYWKLMKLLYPDKRETEYFLLTLVFAGSPYVLGMVAFNSYDYAIWCVFPLLAYFVFSKKHIYAFLTSFYFVFCKEPCVVVYSFFLLGIYIVECIKKKMLIHDVERYVGLLTPCFLWFFFYLFVIHWEFSGGSIFSWEYALNKLKSFTFINFNYLFIVLATFAVVLVISRHHKYLEFFIPITISALAFVAISIFTNAAGMMHARYIDALVSQIYILASFIPAFVVNNIMMKKLLYLLISAISVTSSFWTIDPISKMVYDVVNVGTTEVITTGGTVLSDAGVYNRQKQNFAYITDVAISDICLDNKKLIYMPAVDGITEYFDSLGFYMVVNAGEEIVSTESWNKDKATRMTDSGLEENEAINIHFIVDTTPIDIPNDSTGYYLYTEYAGKELADNIASIYDVIKTDSYEKNGWIMYRMKFQEKN